MDWLLGAIEASSAAQYLRFSRWGYAAVATAHLLGIALLVGAIMSLNLRLLGIWRAAPVAVLARVLVPIAAAGLAIAVVAGLMLFATRASEYADLGVFRLKLVLVALGTLAALMLHRAYGLELQGASPLRLRAHAALSATCWLGALICGRMIAFANE